MVSIDIKIPVLAGNIITVPGTEPSTSLTSNTMEVNIRKLGIATPSVVDLNLVLASIPGSRVIILDNHNSPIRKLLVLPPREADCGCAPDWYAVLLSLARPANEIETETIKGICDAFDDYPPLYGS